MPAFQGLDKALRWLRIQKQYKQREVAHAAGITQAMLCSYEQGKRLPSLPTLEKILDTLEINLADLDGVLAALEETGASFEDPLPAPAAPRRRTGRAAKPPPAPPGVDLPRLLGDEGHLTEEQEEAFQQILDGFCRWLRILYHATPSAARGEP